MSHTRPDKNHKHWHYLYERHRRRQRALGINAKQMAWSQVFSLIGSVVAGALLESNKVTLAVIAGTFVILPGVFDLDGSVGAALSAKINHRLEKADTDALTVFIRSVGMALLISIVAGTLVAATGAGIAAVFFDASYWQVFVLAEGAITLSALLGFPLIGALSVVFRRLRINPDDVVGPIESSIFDMLTVVTLVMVIGWLT